MRALADLWAELAKTSCLDPALIQPSPVDQPSDVAMACFERARQTGQDPHAVAQEIAAQLVGRPELQVVEAVGGYVNLSLRPQFVAQRLAALDVPLLLPTPASSQPVVIEYCSVNLSKPMSVGHLRNLFLGRALVNLYRFAGYKVITDNHIGDWGRTFGIWVVGFQRYSDDQRLASGGVDELGRVYIETSRNLADDEVLADEVQSWLLRLQAGDEEALAYHRRFSQISLAHADHVLDLFGIKFDYTLGESFYQEQAARLIERLIQTGQAIVQADKSVIVDLSPAGFDTPFLIRKSNGSHLYASSDIATLEWREENWQPQRVIYVVGADQKLYFRQLFAFNQSIEVTRAELIHYAHGLIEERSAQGARQKMSSRSGAVNLLSVIDRARSTVRDLVKPGVSQANQDRIALGALAFLEFSHSHSTNILFDWQAIFNLKSRSGPYLQYAVVRLNSILAKSGVNNPQPNFDDYHWQDEHQILIKLLGYPDVLVEALDTHEPSRIAGHVWSLARQLNRYYEQTSVLEADVTIRANRLWLVGLAAQQMTQALGLLGIEVPSEM